MVGKTRCSVLLCGVLALGAQFRSAAAQEPPGSLDDRSRQFLLTGQDPAEDFVPLVPRTTEDTRRLEAIKQFCIGRWLENEYRLGEAIEAYRKALEHDSQSLTLYKQLIFLCSAAHRKQDAAKYLREAIDLAPDDYDLLDRLGTEMSEQGEIEGALEVFKRAVASPKLSPRHPATVLLRFKLGLLSEQLRDFEAAASHYRVVMDAMERPADYDLGDVQARPGFLRNATETYEKLGNTFRLAKQYDDALRAFRRAQTSSPRSTRFALSIAQVYIDQEQFTQAIEQLEKYLEDQTPQGSQAYELLATVLDKLGRSDEILPRIELAAEKDRFNVGLQYFLGTLYEREGQDEKAEQIYTAVLKNGAEDRVYKALARLYHKGDRFRELILLLGSGIDRQVEGQATVSEALDERFAALSSDPATAEKLVEIARQMNQEDAQQINLGARYFVAKVAQAAKLVDASAEFYRLALELRPKAAPIYREFSQMLLSHERHAEAIAVIQQSIDRGGRSQDPEAFSDLAQALELNGQTDEALQAAGRAMELDPSRITGHSAQAWIYMHSGQYQKAAQRYEQIMQDFADNPEILRGARYLVSNVYVQLGDMAKAEQALEQILQEDADDDSANNDLGYLWADQGKNLDRALEMIRKALEHRPDNAAYLDSMGWVLYKLGRYSEAVKYLEDAVAREEGAEDGTILDHLGDVYMRLKLTDKAKQMWGRAAEVLENAKGPRRDEKRLKEIQDKLHSVDDSRNDRTEPRRDRADTP